MRRRQSPPADGGASPGGLSPLPARVPFRRSKYRAQPVTTEEGRFASKKEYADWCELKLREKAGLIQRLERQVRIPITINQQTVCTYIADAIWFENGERVVFDSKGYETPEFKLKRKLLKAVLNINLRTTL